MTEMTESGALDTWSTATCPFSIEYSRRALDDIRLAVVDAFFSLPRGGAEIGGVLLGHFKDGRVTIVDYAPLECDHIFGPSFTLSPGDHGRLTEMLASLRSPGGDLQPVGWYHSHTRSDIFLSDADLDIHNRYFPESWQVALVLRPSTFQPVQAGFFFRERDGSIQTRSSYQEFSLDPLPVGQVPRGMPTPAPQAGYRQPEPEAAGPTIELQANPVTPPASTERFEPAPPAYMVSEEPAAPPRNVHLPPALPPLPRLELVPEPEEPKQTPPPTPPRVFVSDEPRLAPTPTQTRTFAAEFSPSTGVTHFSDVAQPPAPKTPEPATFYTKPEPPAATSWNTVPPVVERPVESGWKTASPATAPPNTAGDSLFTKPEPPPANIWNTPPAITEPPVAGGWKTNSPIEEPPAAPPEPTWVFPKKESSSSAVWNPPAAAAEPPVAPAEPSSIFRKFDFKKSEEPAVTSEHGGLFTKSDPPAALQAPAPPPAVPMFEPPPLAATTEPPASIKPTPVEPAAPAVAPETPAATATPERPPISPAERPLFPSEPPVNRTFSGNKYQFIPAPGPGEQAAPIAEPQPESKTAETPAEGKTAEPHVESKPPEPQAEEKTAEAQPEWKATEPPSFLQVEPPTRSRRKLWVIGTIAAALVIGAGGYQQRDAWVPQVTAMIQKAGKPAAPQVPSTLPISTNDQQGQLQFQWDGNAPAVAQARDGILTVTDDGATIDLPLDAAHLKRGEFTYLRSGEHVDGRLTIQELDGTQVRGVANFFGALPQSQQDKPADKTAETVDPALRKQNSDLAKQNTDLSKKDVELAKQAEELNRQNGTLQKRVEELTGETTQLKTELAARAVLVKQNADMTRKNTELGQQLDTLVKQNAKLKADLAARPAVGAKGAAAAAFPKQNLPITQTDSQLLQQRDDLLIQIAKLKTDMAAQAAATKQNPQSNADFSKQRYELVNRVSQLESDLAVANARAEKAARQLDELKKSQLQRRLQNQSGDGNQ